MTSAWRLRLISDPLVIQRRGGFAVHCEHAEHQVDLREITGTGIAGRVTKQDILGHLEGRTATPAPDAS